MGWIADFHVLPQDQLEKLAEDPDAHEATALSFDTVVDQNRLVVLWAIVTGHEIPADAEVESLMENEGGSGWLKTLAEDDGWVFEVPPAVVAAVRSATDLPGLGQRWEACCDRLGYDFGGDTQATEVLEALRPRWESVPAGHVVVMHERI